MTPGATLSWGFTRYCGMKRASSSRPTWTRRTGRTTPRRYLETCRRLELPAALERSRSGHGGHVWLFFDQAIPATLARKLGAHLLTETMERRPGIGLDSYDRFFPNQDTLPQGGFGNLIALPLQKRPREHGNSVFLDENQPAASRPMGVSVERPQDRSGHRRSNCCRSRTEGTRCRRAPGARRRGRRRSVGRASFAPPYRASACRTAARPARIGARRSNLYRQGCAAARFVQSPHPPGRVSESRVLQGAGDASADVRQAAHHRLRRGTSAAHRTAARLPG